MNLHDFYYDLPQELIAQDPLEDRSSSRLMVLDQETGHIEHHIFREIIDYLNPGDCLVVNNTKVIPARLMGSKVGTDAHIDVLLRISALVMVCWSVKCWRWSKTATV